MPLFHISGLIVATVSPLIAGGSVICTPGFEAPRFFDWVRDLQPTWYTAVPTIHQAILARAAQTQEVVAGTRLRFIRSSAAPLAPKVLEELEVTFHVPVVEAYSLTESSGTTCNPLPPRARKPGSVGISVGPEIAIAGERDVLLPTGEPGEVVVRGDNVLEGYENDAEANAAAFFEGWFRTGDRGYFDQDGYLYLSGRLKEMINRGGQNISPREIEESLLQHPAVAESAAFAVEDERLGEDLAAAVVLRPGSVADEPALQQFAAERLAEYKVPTQIRIVAELPKGPTGKIQRIGLAAKLGITAVANDALRAPHVAPSNPVEELVAQAWSEVLRVENPGINDNFFFQGGDSLLATRLLARLNNEVDMGFSLQRFFAAPTIAAVAGAIEEYLLAEPHGNQ